MGKFRDDSSTKEIPAISTSSLPDIIFMLLFFFMVATQMKEVEYKVSIQFPEATQLTKLEEKSLVKYIYVGTPQPKYRGQYGSEPRVQLDDAFAEVGQIGDYIVSERSAMDEKKQPYMVVSLKVDKDCKMGIVTDIKQELRRNSALKINYAAAQRANDSY
ncbi:MAG: biopolymer transporter ExbD [Paludibacteraceae bacterium]|nr:biopolymer transporter ExbD [Paludibacteraceae bacterium]